MAARGVLNSAATIDVVLYHMANRPTFSTGKFSNTGKNRFLDGAARSFVAFTISTEQTERKKGWLTSLGDDHGDSDNDSAERHGGHGRVRGVLGGQMQELGQTQVHVRLLFAG